jgi:hypothetical protein
MATLPSSLLNRLYEQNSLHNTETGFELAFKNRLAPSTMVGVQRLSVDGLVFERDAITVRLERPAVGHRRPPEPLVRKGSQISDQKSLPFELNTIAWIIVHGTHLPPGEYQVSWTFTTREVGDITVQATDQVTDS